MERRSWPWKKKSSEKSTTDSGNTSTSNPNGNQIDEEDSKVEKYVQISPEQYSHFTDAVEQVKLLNEKLSVLDEKLSSAQSELSTKEGLVKQHAKVAEEAISGWEKAEAEASALKVQLETVTLSRLASDERAAHLDGALKECMKQIRAVKEESEQKLHDVVFAKTKQWEQVRAEFEAKIIKLEQELLRASAENDALSRSIEEYSNMLMKISEEKVQAEAEIDLLKSTIQSDEREINSLKYELHVASKEVAIRHEEKNMSVRSADIANKQHLEDVKKISKLEAECQRLRGLVRKKLPGPAALAQMKMEVESLGREYGNNRLRRSPAKSSSYHHASPQDSEFALDNSLHLQKENEFLTARLLAMEEETQMLKEVLSKRNSELQTVRGLYTKTASKLHIMEVQSLVVSQQSPKSNVDVPFDSPLNRSVSNPPISTSLSEYGVDDETCKGGGRPSTANSQELLDDFLEMERLASEGNASVGFSDMMKIDSPESNVSVITERHEDEKETQASSGPRETPSTLCEQCDPALSELWAKISSLFGPQSPQKGVTEVILSIRHLLDDIAEAPCCRSEACEDAENVSRKQNDISCQDGEFRNAISCIHDLVKSVWKESAEFQGKPSGTSDSQLVSDKMEFFSAMVQKVLLGEKNLHDLIVALANVLPEVNLNLVTSRSREVEISSVDFVDKVTLLENKVNVHKEDLTSLYSIAPRSSDVNSDGAVSSGSETKADVLPFSIENYEQLKSEKASLEMQLVKCNEKVESTEQRLSEMQQNMEKLRSELTDSQNSNSLADTQLKCMAESYRSLESSKLLLEEELKALRVQVDALMADLAEEREAHEKDLEKYRVLEEQFERCKNEKIDADSDEYTKLKQEAEIAAATEKLAECQETILLLGRQLQAMRPMSEQQSSPTRSTHRMDVHSDDETSLSSGIHSRKPSSQMDPEQAFPGGGKSPLGKASPAAVLSDSESSPQPNSPNSSKRQKHRSTASSSSLMMLVSSPENQGRGFSRFFSNK